MVQFDVSCYMSMNDFFLTWGFMILSINIGVEVHPETSLLASVASPVTDHVNWRA